MAAIHPSLPSSRALWSRLAALVLGASAFGQQATEVACEEQRLRPQYAPTNNSTEFGAAVDIEGGFAIVGAPRLDWVDDGTGSSTFRVGGAYVFRIDDTQPLGDRWVLEDTLFHSVPQVGDLFGKSVAISGSRLVVGCPADNHSSVSNAGSALVFRRALNGAWIIETILRDPNPGQDDLYGWAVDIEGDTIAVGSYLDDNDASGAQSNEGSVFLYERDPVSGVWTLINKLEAPDPGQDDAFGASVSLNGEYVAIGADFDNVGTGLDAGSVYVMQRDAVGQWNPLQRLTASDSAAGFQFGCSLDMEGTTLIVGACRWDQNPGDEYGAAYVFEDVGGAWIETALIVAADGQPGDRFGRGVAVDGSLVAVGALAAEKAYLYRYDGTAWTPQGPPLRSDNADSDARFGQSIAVNGSRVLLGAPNDFFSGSAQALDSGTAYLFAPPDTVTESYCTAKPSSLTQVFPGGPDVCLPTISAGGTRVPSLSRAEDFRITGRNIVVAAGNNAAVGVLMWGTVGRRDFPYHGGSLCVRNHRVYRPRRFEILPPGAAGTCLGVLTVNLAELAESDAVIELGIGQPVQAQWLFRDPGDALWGEGLTDALEFVPCP